MPLPSLHRERRAAVPSPSERGERAIVATADTLIAKAADACARGALREGADAYRDAAAVEARTGDLERALACLRMASSLRAEMAQATSSSDA